MKVFTIPNSLMFGVLIDDLDSIDKLAEIEEWCIKNIGKCNMGWRWLSSQLGQRLLEIEDDKDSVAFSLKFNLSCL